MAHVTPTTKQVAENVIAQLESALSQAVPLLPRAFLRVLAKVISGVYVTLYKYAGFSLLQQFVATASMQETVVNGKRIRPLVEWGRLSGVGDPIGATQAELEVEVTVLNQTGSLPAGTQALNPTTGVVYLTTAAVPLNAATVTATVRAASDQLGGDGSGVIGNVADGQTLQLASAPATVATTVAVMNTNVVGAEAEQTEAYRARVLRRFRRRPQGGAYADYDTWGGSVAGVRRIFPYTGLPGEVDVYVESTDLPDGIPGPALLAAVEQAIQFDPAETPSPTGLANRRPVNAAVNVLPITRTAFDVAVVGLVADDPPAVIASIETGLDEFLRSREPFIVGLSAFPRLDRVTQGFVAGVVSEIAEANGASVAAVRLLYSGGEITQYTLAKGETAKLGNVIEV